MGVSPSAYRWSKDSKTLFFDWNPDQKQKSELFKTGVGTQKPVRAAEGEDEKAIGSAYIYNTARTLGLTEKGGDLFLFNFKSGKETQLTRTNEREDNATFLTDGRIAFQRAGNFYSMSLEGSQLRQLSNFLPGTGAGKSGLKKLNVQEDWLNQDQKALFDVLKDKEAEQARGRRGSRPGFRPLKQVYLGDRAINGLSISPSGKFIAYRLMEPASGNRQTFVPNYVTASGFTEPIPGRTKVGEQRASYENFIYDTERDTVYQVKTGSIPGLKDLPDYLKDYPKETEVRKKANRDRDIFLTGPYWNTDGSRAMVIAYANDNKDRWILSLDAGTGALSLVNRQRDEAWIGGPGIGAFGTNTGWIDRDRFWFQSEQTGFSHLYVVNLLTGKTSQLTDGRWEVQSVLLSNDKKTFYFKANIEHPGITHFYRIPASGGKPEKLTGMKGANEVTLSPDEKWLAINYSYMNKPWELYLQPNRAGATAVRITKSTTAAFDAYAWREPDVVEFKNRHGASVYARVYPAKTPHANRPAVVFVHGAGYLQNVHFWWSQYFREYMFHNLLADQGYTVIDIDYTGSSGYGRDHRTGIYRHMGGKDLSDQVDGVKMLVEKYNVNPESVGIYGGSYGGFMTLMALFNASETFSSGAALRSVTDWAHYNHGYTSNILNEPFNDPIAYKRSSPIYFADKLKGNLLMCHGMVDVNVHFQDIVRLSQRFIELGKDNWELAVYPVEDHGFTEPSSWTDEYKRIYKLFESTLKKQR
ncbi:S9 family peptidase [Pedobacter yulinensis]|uniref:S9 family peptidase n=2 Tax=Pedobacter yulinensis TaxID=2126353 RepID=A0A2T3HS74_9SPHI|nr:S9 family peptidase [Pedobacter yulinensis]